MIRSDGVTGENFQFAGEAGIAVATGQVQHDLSGRTACHLPEAVGVTETAVKSAVLTVIETGLVNFAVDGKSAAADTVGNSAHGCAEVTGIAQVYLRLFPTEYHIPESAVAVGHKESGYGGAVVANIDAEAVVESQAIDGCQASIRQGEKRNFFHNQKLSVEKLKLLIG